MMVLNGSIAPASGYGDFTGHLPEESPLSMCSIFSLNNAVSNTDEAELSATSGLPVLVPLVSLAIVVSAWALSCDKQDASDDITRMRVERINTGLFILYEFFSENI